MKKEKQIKSKSIPTTLLSILFLSVTLFAASCSDDDDDDNGPAQQTVLDIAVANDNFDVLAAAAARAGLGSTLDGNGPLTVFAPTDEAFRVYLGGVSEADAITAVTNLPVDAAADLLMFHVISGSEIESGDLNDGTQAVTTAREGANNKAFVTKNASGVTINNALVTDADVNASNGVIHIIDAVLTPPAGNIITVATTGANTNNFQLLAAALTQAGLVDDLQGNGPFTVFAPDDDAFLGLLRTLTGDAELSETEGIAAIGAIDADSEPLTLAQLTSVLQYHVVNNTAAYSINLTDGQVIPTLAGATNTLTIDLGATVIVDGSESDPATVTTANVSATNGVIHVIDRVLLLPLE